MDLKLIGVTPKHSCRQTIVKTSKDRRRTDSQKKDFTYLCNLGRTWNVIQGENLTLTLKHERMAFEFTDTNFQDKAMTSGVAVVDFWAEWCGPCRMIAPVIEELASDYDGKALVGKVDVDSNPEVSMQFGVRSIPTILIIKDGEVVHKHVGVTTKQALADKIESYLWYDLKNKYFEAPTAQQLGAFLRDCYTTNYVRIGQPASPGNE